MSISQRYTQDVNLPETYIQTIDPTTKTCFQHIIKSDIITGGQGNLVYLPAMGGGCGVLALGTFSNIRRSTETNVDILFQIIF
ncbi:MAG: hypothetical protein ACYSTX_05235 [Planctomycetota bacterium]